MSRFDDIDELYAYVSESTSIPHANFIAAMMDWNIVPVVMDGVKIGLMVTRDSEIHFKLDPKLILKHTRRVIRNYIEPMLRRVGYLTTTARQGSADVPFLERFGFYQTRTDDDIVHFRLDKLKIR